MSENKGSNAFEVAVSFVIGAATGFILGILFAPAAGKDTRKKIQLEMAKTGEKAKELALEAEKGIKAVKEKTQEGIGAIRDFIEKKREKDRA
ncbi:MAG: YtxH domain-containing protein [Candidatus Aminicenantes bacterium]|nr:YtxH domain-containing protein [Candidatus Aminicenantes bacterium]